MLSRGHRFSLRPLVWDHMRTVGGDVCAEARSETKRQRYATLATEAGADNLPAVFETFGGMSASTTRLLHRLISSHAVRPGVNTPRQFVRMIREGLSICLQRGNAMVDHMGLQWASHASSRLAPLIQLPSDSRRTRCGLSSQTGSRHLRRYYERRDIRRRQFRC